MSSICYKGIWAIVVLLLSACASFQQPGISTVPRYLIDEEAFIQGKQSSPPPAPARPAHYASYQRSRINLLAAAKPSPQTIKASPVLSLRLVQVPLRIFLYMLSELTGYNIVLSPQVDAVLSQQLNAVAWRHALATIAELHGLEVDEKYRLIRLYPKQEKDAGTHPDAASALLGDQVELFRLRYADTEQAATLLKSLLRRKQVDSGADDISVVSDKRTQSLIVTGNRRTIELADSLIRTIDVPTRQVMIEAFIVEAGEDFERALGARLGRQREGIFSVQNINGPYLDAPAVGASGGLGLTFGSARIRVELTALEKAGKSRLVSNPKVFTLDNQPAMIFEGSEVPYQTVSEGGTQTEFKQAGLKLAVTPSIVNHQHLMLDVAINKDTVDTRLSNPPITRRELTSRLLVRSGDVVAIGGIYLKRNVRAFSGLPFINHLPLIGSWFQNRKREGDIKQLVVFIAPKIV